jgi:hypothetical protein
MVTPSTYWVPARHLLVHWCAASVTLYGRSMADSMHIIRHHALSNRGLWHTAQPLHAMLQQGSSQRHHLAALRSGLGQDPARG